MNFLKENRILFEKVSLTHLFFALFFFSTHLTLSAYTTLDQEKQIYSAYQDVIKLKLNSGREKLDRIIPSETQLGHYHFVKSLADAIEIIVTEDPALYKAYDDSEYDNLKGLRNLPDDDPHKLFYAAEIRIHWSIVKILFDDEVRAALSLKTAYGDIKQNVEDFPDFKPNLKSFGGMHVLFDVVPESYHWIMRWLGIEANSIRGWQELNQIKRNSPYWTETNMIKALIALNIINQEKRTMQILEELKSEQEDNLIINYIYNVAHIKYARSDDAELGLNKLAYASKKHFPIQNIYYKLGEINMQKQRYSLARFYYTKFIDNHKGRNYIKDAWFKVFLSYWLDDNNKMADLIWKNAQKAGRASIPADRNADDIMNEGEYPNQALMKARLATDGGYFHLATIALDGIKQGTLKNKKEECEYFYRYGRLFDKQGKDDEAIFYYLNAIKKSGKENWYFAPNASLHTGYIYVDKGDIEKATFYFEKAMSYKKHKYKIGIDSKAKAALELLGGQ